LFTPTNSWYCTTKWCLIKDRYGGHSTTKFPYIITVKWQVTTTLHVAHLFSWTIIIFHHNPPSHWCICPSWHQFKIFIVTEIHNHSWRAKSTSPLSYNLWPAVLLQRSELHFRYLCLSSEMKHMSHRLSTAYFHHYKIFKMTRWGKCISIDGEYDENRWYFGGISDLHWGLWWLVFGAEDLWSLIYCTFLVGFNNI
jgi:hypothetical protein